MYTKPSWPQRFVAALPRIPDSAMVLGLLVLVFACGMLFGCLLTLRQRLPDPPPPALMQHQLEVLEHRVWVLEQRQTP